MATMYRTNLKGTLAATKNDKTYLPFLGTKDKINKDFVLNCDSSDWKLPTYSSLQDKHLPSYFNNTKVRSVLAKNGIVDESGNISRKIIQGSSSTNRMNSTRKLPPITEVTDTTIEKIAKAYQIKDIKKLTMVKKAPSMPERRINILENTISLTRRSQTLPKTIKVPVAAPIANIRNITRKVQPLSKEQLEEVFAKYKINTVNISKPLSKVVMNESTIEEENSTDFVDRKSDASSYNVNAQKIQELYETFGGRVSQSSPCNIKSDGADEYDLPAKLEHISSDYITNKSGATLEPKVEDEVEYGVDDDKFEDEEEVKKDDEKAEAENDEYADAEFEDEDEKAEKSPKSSECEEDD